MIYYKRENNHMRHMGMLVDGLVNYLHGNFHCHRGWLTQITLIYLIMITQAFRA